MKQNYLPRIVTLAASCVFVIIAIFHLYTSWFISIHPYAQRYLTLSLILIAGLLTYPIKGKSSARRSIWWFLPDLICILLVIAINVYVFRDLWGFMERASGASDADVTAGILIIVLVLELSRRVLGWPITIVAAFLLLQNYFGPYLPWIFYGPPISWHIIIESFFMLETGLFGIPIKAMTEFLIMFFIFVAFLQQTSAGDFFIDLAKAVAGRFAGGPAKVAVVASAGLGTITGSPIANVTGTGSITIPLMKRLGYRPEFAAAVEACSSTGAQYMPPVMGVTAFLIVQFLGVPYYKIMIATLIPCLLFYVAIFASVHFEAKKTGLSGLRPEEIPPLGATLRWGWVTLLPIGILVYFLYRAYPLGLSAMWAVIAIFFVSFLQKRTRLTPESLLVALKEGGRLAIMPGVACAVCGIIIGTFALSGLGEKVAHLIITASYGYVWLAVIWTAVACIVLGMGVPTPIIYVMMLVITIPALVKMGVNLLAAHMFTFYLGVASGLTPPVAVVSYAAAGIAEAPIMRTCWQAVKIAAVAYVTPFLFVFAPELLGTGAIGNILLHSVTGMLGAVFMAAGFVGWFMHSAGWVERLCFGVGGLMLLIPSPVADLVGLVLLAPTVFSHLKSRVVLGRANEKI